jgi:hypothetical protein
MFVVVREHRLVPGGKEAEQVHGTAFQLIILVVLMRIVRAVHFSAHWNVNDTHANGGDPSGQTEHERIPIDGATRGEKGLEGGRINDAVRQFNARPAFNTLMHEEGCKCFLALLDFHHIVMDRFRDEHLPSSTSSSTRRYSSGPVLYTTGIAMLSSWMCTAS